MNLKQTIYLSLAAVAVVIGIHQSMIRATVAEGVAFNYWLFMGAIVFLMLYRHEAQKKKRQEQEQTKLPHPKQKKRPQRK
jgi:hypothetical protein